MNEVLHLMKWLTVNSFLDAQKTYGAGFSVLTEDSQHQLPYSRAHSAESRHKLKAIFKSADFNSSGPGGVMLRIFDWIQVSELCSKFHRGQEIRSLQLPCQKYKTDYDENLMPSLWTTAAVPVWKRMCFLLLLNISRLLNIWTKLHYFVKAAKQRGAP